MIEEFVFVVETPEGTGTYSAYGHNQGEAFNKISHELGFTPTKFYLEKRTVNGYDFHPYGSR